MNFRIADSRHFALITGAAACTVIAVLVLAVTADPSPTTIHTRRLFGLWRASHAAVALLLVLVGGCLLAAMSRQRLLGFLATLTSVAATILVLETLGAIGLVRWNELFAPTRSEVGMHRAPKIEVKGRTYQDTASIWGLASQPLQFEYRTDRHGFRNQPDRPSADVYLLGDSMLVAALVPFEGTLVARLERLLARPVMQVALIGLGPQAEHQLFRDSKLDPRGKIVVQFIYEANDLGDSRNFRLPPAPPEQPGRLAASLVNQGWHALLGATQPRSSRGTGRTCQIDRQVYTFLWARNSFAGVEDEAPVITDAIARFAEEVRQGGGRFLTVLIPSKLRVLAALCAFSPGSELADVPRHLGPLQDHMHAWSKATGHDLLDLTAPLQASARAGRIPWFWGDTHWNETGHVVAAEAVGGWQPLRDALSR